MPDGLFHIAAADLACRCRSRELPHLLFGAILPDLLSRPLARILPLRYALASDLLHTPLVTLLLAFAYLLAFLPESRRSPAGRALVAGIATHFGLDALQKQLAALYFWFFPFSCASGGMGIFWPEESLLGIPLLLGGILAVRASRALAKRRRRKDSRSNPVGS